MQSLNFTNLAKKHNELAKHLILVNMANELEEEPSLSYAIKYHLLKQVNEFNKRQKSEEIKNFIRGLLELLYKEKQQIGKLQDHYKNVEGIVISEYKALIDEFNSQQFNIELIQNFLKIAKLFEVLTVFDCDDQKKQNYLKIAKNAQKYAVKIKKALQENQVQPQPQRNTSMLSRVKIQQVPEMISNNQQHNTLNYEQSTLQIQNPLYDKMFPLSLTENVHFNQLFDNKIKLSNLFDQVFQKDQCLSRIKYKFNKKQIQKQFTQSFFF